MRLRQVRAAYDTTLAAFIVLGEFDNAVPHLHRLSAAHADAQTIWRAE